MKTFKKIAASVAAAAMATACVVVTASADYQIEGKESSDGKYTLTVSGIPKIAFDYPRFTLQMKFYNDDGYGLYTLNLNYADIGGVPLWRSNVADGSNNQNILRELHIERSTNLGSGETVFNIEFDKDDEYLSELMKCSEIKAALGVCADPNDPGSVSWIDINGNEAQTTDNVTFTWQALSSTSEPTSSAPVSEPVSEPASTPASESTASTTENSAAENTTSEEKNNPVTGIGGIGFIAASAIIAGAAVVALKKK